MSKKIVKVGKALKAVAKDEKNRREFLRACEKVRKKHNKLNNIRMKILKVCLREMDEIGIPVTHEEKDLMVKAIELYDGTLQELKDDANQFRGYLAIDETTPDDEREMMYNAEKTTIKSWLEQIGCNQPVGYWYNYGARKLILYTDRPGQLIGKHGKDIDVLRKMLTDQMAGEWAIELVEIKGGFVV